MLLLYFFQAFIFYTLRCLSLGKGISKAKGYFEIQSLQGNCICVIQLQIEMESKNGKMERLLYSSHYLGLELGPAVRFFSM